MATVIGKHADHLVSAEVGKDGKALKILSWTVDGKPASKPKAKKVVGTTFESAGKAGVAVFVAMHDDYGTPASTEGRRMVFKAEGSSKPVNAREVGAPKAAAPKAAKASKNGASATVEEKPAKASRPARRARVFHMIEEHKNQEGVQKGRKRYVCHACAGHFIARPKADGSPPDKCAKGHDVNDPQFADLAGGSAKGELVELEI